MTMFPPAQYYHHECLYSNKDFHSCYLNDEEEEVVRSTSSFSSDHTRTIMADQGDKSSTSNNNNDDQEAERDHEEWLQLSIGGGGHQVNTRSRRSLSLGGNNNNLVELDLLNQQQQQVFRPPEPVPVRVPSSLAMFTMMPGFRIPAPNTSFNMSLLLQQQGPTSARYNSMAMATFGTNPQEMMANWALRPTANLVPRPYHNYNVEAAGPSSESRLVLIDPPRNRPHSGIWFMLQASPFQGREPCLPQIPKSYLRIKDGRLTVRFIMKYVANKLRLDSESEESNVKKTCMEFGNWQIEITCRGQHLVPFLTLQHVRDNIWINQRDTPTTTIALLPSSSTEDHVMVLRYGRTH